MGPCRGRGLRPARANSPLTRPDQADGYTAEDDERRKDKTERDLFPDQNGATRHGNDRHGQLQQGGDRAFEFRQDRDYWAAVFRCHRSIGRAIYYTSVTIMLGFSILAFSRFVPTIYFGVLTSLAMLVALLANITLLPLLLVSFRSAGEPADIAADANS